MARTRLTIDVLVRLAGEAGLRVPVQAREVLASDEYAQATRQREQESSGRLHRIPCRRIILNRQHLISGGQPVEAFERALRQVAGAANTSAASVQSA